MSPTKPPAYFAPTPEGYKDLFFELYARGYRRLYCSGRDAEWQGLMSVCSENLSEYFLYISGSNIRFERLIHLNASYTRTNSARHFLEYLERQVKRL